MAMTPEEWANLHAAKDQFEAILRDVWVPIIGNFDEELRKRDVPPEVRAVAMEPLVAYLGQLMLTT